MTEMVLRRRYGLVDLILIVTEILESSKICFRLLPLRLFRQVESIYKYYCLDIRMSNGMIRYAQYVCDMGRLLK